MPAVAWPVVVQLASSGPPNCQPVRRRRADRQKPLACSSWVSPTALDATALRALYQACLNRLHLLERYPSPDWSIADKWVARELLQTGTPTATVAAVLCQGSPGFPRRHADPEDYLRRTIDCAAR